MQAARDAQRHRVLQSETLPAEHPPCCGSGAVFQSQQRADHTGGIGCTAFFGVSRLPFDRLGDRNRVHQCRFVRHRLCVIALSSGPSYLAAMPQSQLTFAVPKGRLLDDALPVMERAGVVPEAGFHDKSNRALCFATTRDDLRLIRVRAFDVATFVAHGAAQIGIVGSDVIEEFDYSDLYAPVDLDIGHCHLAVAQEQGENSNSALTSHVRVATKYPNITRRHYERQGIQAECVKLNGAMELAPSLGLARRIVDLVSSGKTLKENGLVETDRILGITARLIVNRAALKTDPRVAALVQTFRHEAEARAAGKVAA